MRSFRVSALLAVSLCLYADDLESLHIVNVNFDFNKHTTLQLHSRVRTFEDISAYNQFRVGPVLTLQLRPGTGALLGYYFTDQNRPTVHTRYQIHRPWAGIQVRAIDRKDFWLDTRLLGERFISDAFTDYWRVRSRAMLWKPTPVGLGWVSGEALRNLENWYGRYTVGLQWKPQDRLMLSLSYEYRQSATGAPSHVIATTLQWQGLEQTPQHID